MDAIHLEARANLHVLGASPWCPPKGLGAALGMVDPRAGCHQNLANNNQVLVPNIFCPCDNKIS